MSGEPAPAELAPQAHAPIQQGQNPLDIPQAKNGP